jgi:hypothetical protein
MTGAGFAFAAQLGTTGKQQRRTLVFGLGWSLQ